MTLFADQFGNAQGGGKGFVVVFGVDDHPVGALNA